MQISFLEGGFPNNYISFCFLITLARTTRTGVSKLWPASHIQPTALFCMTFELKMGFTFLNGWGKLKRRII